MLRNEAELAEQKLDALRQLIVTVADQFDGNSHTEIQSVRISNSRHGVMVTASMRKSQFFRVPRWEDVVSDPYIKNQERR